MFARFVIAVSDTCVMSVAFCMQVWNLTNCKLKTNHYGHTGYLNCVTVSPDGSLCASGGKVRTISGQSVLRIQGSKLTLVR